MEWIPITEQLPPLDAQVLIVCWYDDEPSIFLGALTARGWRTFPDDEDRFPLETTSHWLPIPTPPPR